MRWLDSIIHSMDMNLNKSQEIVKDRQCGVLQSMGFQTVRHNLVTEQQQSSLSGPMPLPMRRVIVEKGKGKPGFEEFLLSAESAEKWNHL